MEESDVPPLCDLHHTRSQSKNGMRYAVERLFAWAPIIFLPHTTLTRGQIRNSTNASIALLQSFRIHRKKIESKQEKENEALRINAFSLPLN